MAYPVVASTAFYNGSTSAAIHNVSLPTGIVAGDLLISAVSLPSASATIATSLHVGCAEWKLLGEYKQGTAHAALLFWRIAAAGSTANKLMFYPPLSMTAVALTLRITGGDFTDGAYAMATGVVNSSHSSFTTAATGRDHLWLAVRCGDSTVLPSAIPTGYTSVFSSAGVGSTISVARKDGTNTESPSAWTVTSNTYVTFTLAIYARPRLAGTVLDPTSPTPVAAMRRIFPLDRTTGNYLKTHASLLPTTPPPELSGLDGTFNFKVPANADGYSLVFQAIEPGYQDLFVSSVTPVYD